MPFFIISVVIQVALVLHIVKTGRNTTWIWIVVMLPLAGSIAYFIVEVLPGLSGSTAGRVAKRTVSKTINPNKDFNQALADLSVADTVENSTRLAEELMGRGKYEEAKSLYQRCLKGAHETDPYILSGLAKAEFALRNFEEARLVLDNLIEHNPDFKNADSHLLYARALENSGDEKAALHEYEVLQGYFPGPEASVHYASLCREMGNHERSNDLLDDIVKRAKTAGGHYNSLHKEWIQKAKSQVRR